MSFSSTISRWPTRCGPLLAARVQRVHVAVEDVGELVGVPEVEIEEPVREVLQSVVVLLGALRYQQMDHLEEAVLVERCGHSLSVERLSLRA